ncbi:MAG TPA: hypothetical protein VKA12_07460 [Roseiarcus sp.]|nr:hypothetical protein [Roseiarcus sp.]
MTPLSVPPPFENATPAEVTVPPSILPPLSVSASGDPFSVWPELFQVPLYAM